MPDLCVTEEQLERLDALRADLEAVFVDGYGHVRRRDALDYLLDTHAPPVEVRARVALDREVRDESGALDYPALQSVARNTEGVRGSGIGAEEMYEAVLEAKVGEAASGDAVGFGVDSPRAEGGAAGGSDGSAGVDDGTETAGGDGPDEHAPGDGDAGGAGGEAAGTEPSDGNEEADDADERESASATRSANPNPNDGGGSQLQAMMNLLSTHEDKWREAESGDAPYEVDLPDGGTEPARTKDDVKRILFTNY